MKKKIALFALVSLFYGLSSQAGQGPKPKWRVVNNTDDAIDVVLVVRRTFTTTQPITIRAGKSGMITLDRGACLPDGGGVRVNGTVATRVTGGRPLEPTCNGGTIEIDKKWDNYSARNIFNYMLTSRNDKSSRQ